MRFSHWITNCFPNFNAINSLIDFIFNLINTPTHLISLPSLPLTPPLLSPSLLFLYFRYLVPQTIPNTDSVHAFLTSVAHESLLSSWRDFQTQLDKTNSTSDDEDEVTRHKNQCATPLNTVRSHFASDSLFYLSFLRL